MFSQLYMPYYPRKKVGYRKKRVYKKRTTKTVKKPTRTFVKQVQNIIHKSVESKQAFHNQPYYAKVSGITAVNDILRVLPAIDNGTGPYQRIGDQLKCQSLNIKGNILLNAQLTSTFSFTRVAVRLMVVTPKRYGTYLDVTGQSNWLSGFLQKGAATTQFTGAQSDLFASINREAITVHYDKVYYLNSTYQATAVGYAAPENSIKFFNINIKCKNKILKYDPSISSTLLPTNFAPVLLFGYVFMNGAEPTVVNTPVSVQFDTLFTFEDA